MKKSEKISIELMPYEYNSLIGNEMIKTICGDMLVSPRKRGGSIVLRLTEEDLEELVGFVAAEANHAKTREEEEALGDVFDNLIMTQSRIRMG